MSSSVHQDPPSAILEEILVNFPVNPRDLYRYVQQHLPGWVIYMSKQFSVDLGKFNLEWAIACNEMNVEPQKILIVCDTYMKERSESSGGQYKLVQTAIEKLSTAGYVVMGNDQFEKCLKCGELIVSRAIMEKKNLKFSGKCQGCYKYNPREI